MQHANKMCITKLFPIRQNTFGALKKLQSVARLSRGVQWCSARDSRQKKRGRHLQVQPKNARAVRNHQLRRKQRTVAQAATRHLQVQPKNARAVRNHRLRRKQRTVAQAATRHLQVQPKNARAVRNHQLRHKQRTSHISKTVHRWVMRVKHIANNTVQPLHFDGT